MPLMAMRLSTPSRVPAALRFQWLSAALAGDEATLARLLESESDPDALLKAADDEGFTALHLAAGAGHEGCLRRLVAAGVAVDLETSMIG